MADVVLVVSRFWACSYLPSPVSLLGASPLRLVVWNLVVSTCLLSDENLPVVVGVVSRSVVTRTKD